MGLSLGNIVDILIVVFGILSFISGWRQGAISAVLSTIGVVSGLICGAALAPFAMKLTDSQGLRLALAAGVVVLLVGIGNLVGGLLGSSLRQAIKWKTTMYIDSVIGAVFQTIAFIFVAWLVAVPLSTALPAPIPQAIQSSKILGFVDNHIPEKVHVLPSKISAMLDDSGLPPMVSPFSEDTTKEVAPPAATVSDQALVERLRPSVIHVLGESQQCSRRLMGSGFVADESHVITNAHVVAGTNAVSLDTVTGIIDAQVVYYNPELDIAVLYAPELNLPVLPWAQTPAADNDEAIVMGFPESGPFDASPARIAEKINIFGPNIYASGRVEREAYVVRGSIRQGNSGGPMVNNKGEVWGVVFGAAVDGSDRGYVLSAKEVRSHIGDISSLTTPVETMACVAN